MRAQPNAFGQIYFKTNGISANKLRLLRLYVRKVIKSDQKRRGGQIPTIFNTPKRFTAIFVKVTQANGRGCYAKTLGMSIKLDNYRKPQKLDIPQKT